MRKRVRNILLSRNAVAVAVASCFAVEMAIANPTAPTVVHGGAAFQQHGNLLQITNSPNTIINWGGFSIGAGEITRFIQQSSASAVLNRVIGQDPSSILGALQSNGRVFLINPNGILFGSGAQVDVAGLVASTLSFSNADFLAGRLRFSELSGAGSIVNQGSITTDAGGNVYLVAPRVTNSGVITSPKGEVILAAGNSVELVSPGTPNLRVEISAPDNEARNLGQIAAEAGRVGIYAGLINHSGTIRADSAVAGENGQILLKASTNTTLEAGSVISANGPSGGSVNVRADSGLLTAAGTITARGDAGAGGSVSLKGDVVIASGEVEASGTAGGSIAVTGRNYLGSGTLAAEGGDGVGGTIEVDVAGRMIQTVSERLSARGTQGGGSITVQAVDRLFSSATLDATGKVGGQVNVLANDIVLPGATIDASGVTGGGTVLIGGDHQGGNPAIRNAQTNWINFATTIRADATTSGDGGKVVVWSDLKTQFAGAISVRGGAQSGNGGFIEVSGKDRLIFVGTADAGAPKGTAGTVLLDPKNIIIDSSGTSGLSSFQLLDPNPGSNEVFADSITVLPNNNVVATDPNDTFATGGSGDSGAAYLFNGTTGSLLSTITGSAARDQVGSGGVVTLSGLNQNNFAVRSPNWSGSRGAVTWGSGTTGFFNGGGTISSTNSLIGSTPSDGVGGTFNAVVVLSNGNYVVRSPNWDNVTVQDVGAVTWASGASGIAGAISSANSLVGSSTSDLVGNSGVTPLTNGNYVVRSPNWDNGAAANAGAATWGNGTSGTSGVVSAANSLVGSSNTDNVGGFSVVALTNGNYVVVSPNWNNGAVTLAGAVTWGNGATGITGPVTGSNSLVGSQANDRVGDRGVTALTNGNYVVASNAWQLGAFDNVGAATWGSGTAGVTGTISSTNSLIGSSFNDQVSSGGITALANGNYVVVSPNWNNGANSSSGAVTWGNGTTGTTGTVGTGNSLYGGTSGDAVGSGGITALNNGNYIVRSPFWAVPGAIPVLDAGAVTWVNGTTGVPATEALRGVAVSAANSLIGSSTLDRVGSGTGGGVTALANGNYVVSSPAWDHPIIGIDVGAVTWGNGTTGVTGAVSASNSLVGGSVSDQVGSGGVTALTNGNYVVSSPRWDRPLIGLDAGAATWVDGTNGRAFGEATVGATVSTANSLVGSAASDRIGEGGVTALANGNYVVRSPDWNGGRGAATFGNGTTGTTGQVSALNSLVGTAVGDLVTDTCGESCFDVVVVPFSNGNYAVASESWDNGGTPDVGAVTFGNGLTGVSGAVSSSNSLIGTTASDFIGSGGVTGSNGSFVVRSPSADNGVMVDAGLVHVVSATSQYFNVNPASDVTISPAAITQMTNTGTSVLLQANNDIVLNAGSPIMTSAGGTGGALTLQAGRSITLNANITSDNGAVTLVANETTGAGVVSAQRDAGAASITMAPGTSINAGSANITIRMKDGSGLANNTSGDIALSNLTTTGHVLVEQGGATAGSDILHQTAHMVTAASAALDISNAANTTGTIGTSGAGIFVTTGNLEARSQGGDIWFRASGPATTIGGAALGALAGISVAGGSGGIHLFALDGDLAVAENVTNAGNATTAGIEFSVLGAGKTLTVNPFVTVQAANVAGGSIDYGADNIDLGISSSTLVANPTRTIGLSTQTLNRNIELGNGAPSTGVLHLSQDELVTLNSANSIGIGASNYAGNISTIGNISTPTQRLSFALAGGNFSAANSISALATTVQTVLGGATTGSIDITGQLAGTSVFLNGNTGVTANNSANAVSQVTLLNQQSGNITFNNNANLQVVRVQQNALGADATITNATGTLLFSGGAGGVAMNGGSFTASTPGGITLSDTLAGNDLTLTSGAAITQTAGSIAMSGSTSVNAGTSITLNQAANDFTSLSANNSGANNVALTDANALTLGSSSVGSGTLTVNAGGAISQTGPITQAGGAGAATFSAGANAIALTNSGNDFTGAVSLNNTGANNVALRDQSSLILGTSSVGGTLTVTAGGAITQSGPLTVSGASTFNTGADAITLTDALNEFSGAISLTNVGANNVALNDQSALILGTSNVGGTLSVTAGGAITQSGPLAVSGASAFNAGANTITLTDALNDFAGAVLLNNSGGNDVAVRDANAVVFGASALGSGSFTVTATSGITQSGAITQSGGAGAATFNAGAGVITLTNAANGFTGPVSLNNSGANNVALTELSALILGPSSVGSGTLTINAGGPITQAGAITQAAGAGAATFSAGANAITVTHAGNDFTGGVSLNNSGLNNVALTDANALTLSSSSVGSGTLTVNAGGAISQTGPITQAGGAGAATFSAGANAIALTNSGNDFTGAVSLNNTGANNVALTDANAIGFGTSSVGSGTLTVVSGGVITQSGPITQAASAGTATFNAGVNAITLTDAGNDFTGTVVLIGSPVSIKDANAITLGALNTSSLTVTATSIGQAGPMVVSGSSTFNGGAIALNDAGNDFTGPVSLNSSGASNVVVTDSNAIVLGASTLGAGTLAVNANGAITQTGAITQASGAGAATFNVGPDSIALTNAGNDFTGAVSLNNSGANNVAVTDANAIVLGTSSVGSGTLTVTAAGPITQTAAITQAAGAGAATFNAGANAITLTNAGNDFTGPVSLNNAGANSISVADANAIALGSSVTGSGTFTVDAASTTFAGNFAANDFTFNRGALTMQAGNTVALTGTTTIASGAAVSAQAGTFDASSGIVNVSGVFETGAGSVSAGSMNILSGGVLRGTGPVNGNVNNLAGTVAPGTSPGILTINGDYLQGSSGVLSIDIGGATPGTQHDQLRVNGNVTLQPGATLQTTLINGFGPAPGSLFNVIQSSGTLTGTFTNTQFPAGSGLSLNYLASNIDVLGPLQTAVTGPLEPQLAAVERALETIQLGQNLPGQDKPSDVMLDGVPVCR